MQDIELKLQMLFNDQKSIVEKEEQSKSQIEAVIKYDNLLS